MSLFENWLLAIPIEAQQLLLGHDAAQRLTAAKPLQEEIARLTAENAALRAKLG